MNMKFVSIISAFWALSGGGCDASSLPDKSNLLFTTEYPTLNGSERSQTASDPGSVATSPILNIASEELRRPYSVHKIPSAFDEKAESLGCNLPRLPNDCRIWKGNETHELLLPILVPRECLKPSLESKTLGQGNSSEANVVNGSETSTSNCPHPITLSWDGSIEIQSGDVLLVRIDDSTLIHQQAIILDSTNDTDHSVDRRMHDSTIAVYQVTRNGHDNCDATDGVLLDITPLKVDNREVVTLYDKDLTLGINLLIVVSELWGAECVRLKVTVKSDNCGENEDCSGKGICYSNISMDGYECQCCFGFVGQHCEEQNACYPSPCKNNGICVDISQGHQGSTFQCLCPYEYTGKTCEERTNPCASKPCQNGGPCIAKVSQFKCQCFPGFSGTLCEYSHQDCKSSPCTNGICVNDENGYKCFCKPGFTGPHCEDEYIDCQTSPCLNGGTCTRSTGRHICACGPGFKGTNCQIKVDLCKGAPCIEPSFCVDRGNNYTCECPEGYYGTDCLIPSLTVCSINPCMNGGTCWSNIESFYCVCKPGYAGTTCEDPFVLETITNFQTINKDNGLSFRMPITIQFEHLHNVYVATGTLACAFLLVALIVTACHCRLHKTYKRLDIWGCKIGKAVQPKPAPNSEWFTKKEKASTATPSRALPSLDSADMYYTLDFSENQNSPLIK